ncbi:MAG TPA: hypothetical protein VKB56_05325, partial [Terriglobales bacterium]|nr:hypothetical protein [Terriglobales bacterium]
MNSHERGAACLLAGHPGVNASGGLHFDDLGEFFVQAAITTLRAPEFGQAVEECSNGFHRMTSL